MGSSKSKGAAYDAEASPSSSASAPATSVDPPCPDTPPRSSQASKHHAPQTPETKPAQPKFVPFNPEDLIVRPLEVADYHKGFLQILSQLTSCEIVEESAFIQRFNEMFQESNSYRTVVVEDISKGKIVGTASMILEKKFIRSLGLVGHIEDVVVDTSYRGARLGQRLVEELKRLGKEAGVYKVILDCAEHNVAFYEKSDFVRKEVQMAWYVPKDS